MTTTTNSACRRTLSHSKTALTPTSRPGAAQQPEQEEDDDDGLTAEERARRRALEYDEEEITGDMDLDRVQMEQQQLVTAQLPLANLPVPAGGKIWHARMPNFLEIRSKPFDEDEWDPKEEDLEAGDGGGGGAGEGESQEVKQRMVPDENVIRWRWTKDQLGQVVRSFPPFRAF